MTWSSYSAFIRDRAIHHEALVCPVRVLWMEYTWYCQAWGFDRASPTEFVRWLRAEEGVTIKQGGRGRLRRCAVGLGLKPEEQQEWVA